MYKFFNVEVMYISYLRQIGQQQKADTEILLNPVLYFSFLFSWWLMPWYIFSPNVH